MEKKTIKHKNIRIKNYDYSQPGYYFITICSRDRKSIFCSVNKQVNENGEIKHEMTLTSIGKTIDKYINNIGKIYCNTALDYYVIMPNHIHFIIIITPGATLALSRIINSFKTVTSKESTYTIWQQNYYEHIIRSEQDLYDTRKYIENNPFKWFEDKYYVE